MLRLKSALPLVPSETRENWRNVGMAIKWACGDDGFGLWHEWSQGTTAGNYVGSSQESQWDSFASYGDERRDGRDVVDLGTIYRLAREKGWREREDAALQKAVIAPLAASIRVPDIKPRCPPLSMSFTARDLKDMPFSPPVYICEGLISEGCSILGARPKKGKSWFALDLARAVATGGEVLGRQCAQGDVLYLALEDTPRRLKDRLAKIAQSEDDWSPALRIELEWPTGEAAIAKLHEWRASVKNPRLVIVDTFQKVKAPAKGRKRSGPDYAEDYEAGAAFQSFYRETGISVLLLHHTTKADPEDPFNALTGTLGVNAAPDSLLVIVPKGQGDMLYGKGRDLPEYDVPVTFDRETCRWVQGAIVEDANRSATEQKIIDVFARADKSELSPAEVYKAAEGLDYDLVKKTMERMIKRHLLVKRSRGMYARAVVPVSDFEHVRAFYAQTAQTTQ